jgi:hypothetical protein
MVWLLWTKPIQTTAHAVKDITVEVVKPVANSAAGFLDAAAERVRKPLLELQRTIISLEQEVAHAKASRINIANVQPLLQTTLVEISFDEYSYEKFSLETNAASTLNQKKVREYLGVISARYKKKIGIDLQQLRFELIESNKVAVSGLSRPVTIGVSDLEITPIHSEIREHYSEGTIIPNRSVILADKDTTPYFAPQLNHLVAKINEPETRFADQNKRLALAFLQLCFRQAGFEVFAKESLANPFTFVEICDLINDRQDTIVRDKEGRILKVESQFEALIDGPPAP